MTTATVSRPQSVAKAVPMPSSTETSAKKKTPAKTEVKPLLGDTIGEAAGAIWSSLSADGPQTLAKLKKSVDIPADNVLAGIGWLAREGKLSFETSGKTVTISLSQE